MRKILFLLLMTSFLVSANARQSSGKIQGKVVDGTTRVVESATIQLIKASDSSLVKMGVAGKEGQYEFDAVPAGEYRIMVTAVGHEVLYSEKIALSAGAVVQVPELQLIPVSKAIGGVVITSRKPMIEQKAGKMVINVDASQTNAGLNALELLEKSPGVTVDNDGNISVKGKQGVLVLIDGKPSYLSGADLAALLKNMQSTQLEQIEVMTNPPARYDAAGNSGIINIKTKKGTVKGMNGNANANYTQGKYPRFNGGINLNYRNDKLNVFGGYNGGRYEGFNNLNIDRKLYDGNMSLVRTIDQYSRPYFVGDYHNFKLGTDYYFSKKDVAGVVVNYGFNNTDEGPYSRTNIRDANGNIQSKLFTYSDNHRRSRNLTSNFNYKHTFDSTGREITADFDYLRYDNRSNSLLTTESRDHNDVKTGDDAVLKGLIPSLINIYSGKVDYIHPFRSGWKLEAGLKSSYVETDNQVEYLRNSGSVWVPDTRSNHFVYEENINAAYAIMSRSIKKWELNLGLRLENTVAKGHQLSNDSSFRRNYTNLFPNVGVGYNASDNHQWNFSYSRRLTRPDYDDLNPFIFFLDSLTYGQGNPYLQPQFTHNFEVSHTFKRFLTTTLNYTETNDIITELLKQNTAKNETYQTRENLSNMRQFGIAIMANIPVRKWWNSNVYVNGYHNFYKGLYNNDPVKISFETFVFNMNNTFTLGKGWNAELSGWYRTAGLEGLLVIKSMGALNAGISKQVLQKKGTLKLGIRDIFWTQKMNGYARYSDVDVDISGNRDSRQVNLSFTYRFGKANIKPERRRSSSADDEASRVKSN
ncbi:MAG: TonB-dependent receptor domain-containing protein [Chitinophagaceae bacterium]